MGDLLGRIASALQRSRQSPEELFSAVCGNGPMKPEAMQQLLSSFEAPHAVVLRAVQLLDAQGYKRATQIPCCRGTQQVGGSKLHGLVGTGQVERSDFHQVLSALMAPAPAPLACTCESLEYQCIY